MSLLGNALAGLTAGALVLTGSIGSAAAASAATSAEPRAAHSVGGAAERDSDFSLRYSTNAAGDIRVIANTLMSCRTGEAGCADAREGRGSKLNNNSWSMQWVDVDDDSATVNSSSAQLSIPAGAPVLFAGLYWGAGDGDSRTGSVPAGAGTVKMRTPASAGYVTVTADTVYSRAANLQTYTAVADVTSLINAAKSGSYTVADVKGRVNATNVMAGWSLIVVYGDSNEPVRALSVFDGLQTVNDGNSVEITVRGFQTPPTGPVRTTLGFVTYEGDLAATGDTLQLKRPDGTFDTLTDSIRPARNFFNSSITNTTGYFTAKTPDYKNQLGFDAGLIAADGKIANGATSATFRASTGQEIFYATALTFSTELFSPRFAATKSSTDLNGAPLRAGDILQYDFTVTNDTTAQTGDASLGTSITDALPLGVTFVSGSFVIDGRSVPDSGDVLGVNGRNLLIHIGAGATTLGGGRLDIGASTRMSFRVAVDGTALDGQVLSNFFEVTGTAATSGFEAAGASNETRDVVTGFAADMTITKVALDQDPSTAGAQFIAGERARYRLLVTNDGPDASGPIVVEDVINSPQSFVSATGTGWDCALIVTTVRCERDGLVGGSSALPITITVAVPSSAADAAALSNTATVAAALPDPDPSNNSSTVPVTVERSADLAIVKEHQAYGAGGTIPAGGAFNYVMTVRNNGPSDASTITVTDVLPSGLSLAQTPSGSGWTCSGSQTITCTSSGLAAGAAPSIITLPVTVDAAVAVSTLTNTAAVAAAEADPEPSNNTSSDPTALDTSLDLLETISSSADAVAGGSVTVTVSSANAGPATLPSGTALTQAVTVPASSTMSAVSGSDWTCPTPAVGPTTVQCTATASGTIPSGSTLPALAFTLDVAVNATGSLPISATVSTPLAERDVANNSASVNLNPKPRDIDLRVQAGNPATAQLVAGGSQGALQYIVSNSGPDSAFGPYRVTLPESPLVAITAATGSAWTCTSGSGLVVCTLPQQQVPASTNLPALDLAVVAPDAATASIVFPLPATVSTQSSSESETDLTNNTAQDTIEITNDASLTLTKTVDASTVNAGETLTYVITLTPSGTSSASDIVITDDFSAIGMTVVSVEQQGCAAIQLASNVVTCTVPLLTSADSVVITVEASAPTDIIFDASLTNYAYASDARGLTLSADATVTVSPVVALTVQKQVTTPQSAGGFEPGTVVDYRIVVTNAGPSPISTAIVTDVLPVGMAPVAAVGSGWSCVYLAFLGMYSCSSLTSFVGAAPPITISALILPGTEGSLTNTATASPPPGHGRAVSDTATIRVDRGVDLDIAHYGVSQIRGGQTWITYASVRNNGPADEPGPITVTVDESGAVAQAAAGSGWRCRTAGDRLTCTRTSGLRAGATAPLLTVRTPSSSSTVEIASTARVSGTARDVDPTNNVSDTATRVVNAADISVTKRAAASAVVGEPVRFDVVLRNAGPGAAAQAVVEDRVPRGMSFHRASSDPRCEEVDGTVTCFAGSRAMEAGQRTTFRLAFTTQAAVGTSFTNIAVGSAQAPDPRPDNNTGRATVVLVQRQVPLVEPPSRIVPGTPTVIYGQVVRTNAGQTADIAVMCRVLLTRGDIAPCRVVRAADGSVVVTTDPTVRVQVRVVTTAPAVTGYARMREVYTYVVAADRA